MNSNSIWKKKTFPSSVCPIIPTKNRNCPPQFWFIGLYRKTVPVRTDKQNHQMILYGFVGFWDHKTKTLKEPHRWRQKSTNQIIHLYFPDLYLRFSAFSFSFHNFELEWNRIHRRNRTEQIGLWMESEWH